MLWKRVRLNLELSQSNRETSRIHNTNVTATKRNVSLFLLTATYLCNSAYIVLGYIQTKLLKFHYRYMLYRYQNLFVIFTK